MNGHITVIEQRLDLLKEAIKANRGSRSDETLREVEWAYDRVLRAVQKLRRDSEPVRTLGSFIDKLPESAKPSVSIMIDAPECLNPVKVEGYELFSHVTQPNGDGTARHAIFLTREAS